MKKCFTLLLAMMISIFLFGESYPSLWKKVEVAFATIFCNSSYSACGRSFSLAEKLAYIEDALTKWGSGWSRMKSTFENNRRELTNPQFHLSFDQRVVMLQPCAKKVFLL